MPALMISFMDGRWCAQLANVPDWLKVFRGATPEVQATYVTEFADQMALNQANFAAEALEIDAADAPQVAQLIFDTDALVYDGAVVYQVVAAGETLLDWLADAGTALLVIVGRPAKPG